MEIETNLKGSLINAAAGTDTAGTEVSKHLDLLEPKMNGKTHTAKRQSGVVAERGQASNFKKKATKSKPMAKDHSHHLSIESKRRAKSPLKELAIHLGTPDMISLGGGLPSSKYFPMENLSARVPAVGRWSEKEMHDYGTTITRGKHDIQDGTGDFDLSVALNYGQGTGSPALLKFIVEHTEMIHDIPYENWNLALTAGNTSALDSCFRLLCNRGDNYLCEEYAFPSAIETANPQGLKPVGLRMDGNGILSSHLAETLNGWKSDDIRGKKPNMLYTVPTGQNPTGCTMPVERRREIYAICQRHDVIILEDEPYYFLQMPGYGPNKQIESPASHEEFISKLVPSFLSLDTDGRVLRLDSFSKVIAPGTRCGWVTGADHLIERIVRHNEVSIQTVCGFSQTFLHQLLAENWGHSGYLEWVMHLRHEYTERRNIMLRAMESFLPRSVCSWVNPSAGMFIWIQVNHRKHPAAGKLDVLALEDQIFQRAVANRVLLVPGSYFACQDSTRNSHLNFRVTFAAADEEQMTEAIRRFGEAVNDEFEIDA